MADSLVPPRLTGAEKNCSMMFRMSVPIDSRDQTQRKVKC